MNTYFKKLDILAFFPFADNLNQKVTLNAATWNIPVVDATALDGAFTTYKPFFMAILIKKTRTPEQVEDHTEQRKILEDFIEPFANQYIIPNKLISNAQCEALGFNRQQEGGFRSKIDTEPHLTLKAKQGSRIQVESRVEGDETRPSKHKDSDGAEIRYFLTTPAAGGGGSTPTTPPAATASTVYTTKFSKKAKFDLQLAETDAGKIITMQSRWVNLTDEAKNGPWSNPAAALVSW